MFLHCNYTPGGISVVIIRLGVLVFLHCNYTPGGISVPSL